MKWLVVVLLLMIGCSGVEKPREHVVSLNITRSVFEQICGSSKNANKAIINHSNTPGRYDYNIDYKIYSCENYIYINSIKEKVSRQIAKMLRDSGETLKKETWDKLDLVSLGNDEEE